MAIDSAQNNFSPPPPPPLDGLDNILELVDFLNGTNFVVLVPQSKAIEDSKCKRQIFLAPNRAVFRGAAF